MIKPTTKQRFFSVAIVATAIGALSGGVENTSAQESQRPPGILASRLSSVTLTDLETAFWVCDYLATTRGVSEVSTCSAVYEALKEHKFGGDADKLVFWWRQNKGAQYRNVAAEISATMPKETAHE